MHITIQFEHELMFRAEEVRDVVPQLMLPTKLQIFKFPISQQLPSNLLRRSLILPKLPYPLHQARKLKATPIVRLLAPFSPWEKGRG